jgi:hypothetical protein
MVVNHEKGVGDDEDANEIDNHADFEVANDIAVNHEKGVGDDEDANEIDNHADFEVANNIPVDHSCVTEQYTGPVTNTTIQKKCDWHEIGMCVMIGIDAVDKCQDSLGRCNNYIHHLCQITYIEKSDENTGKREVKGWEFYYEDWMIWGSQPYL